MTARDTSGSGNDGVLTNMVEADWIDGRFGKALFFDGVNNYVTAGNPVNGSLNPEFVTVAAWVNPALLQGQYIVSKDRDCDTPGQGGYSLRMNSRGNVGGDIWRNSNQTMLSVYGQTSLVPGNWYHVVMTFDGSNVRVYVNGALDAISTTVAGEKIQPSAKSLIIGALSYQVPSYFRFKGQIDEVRVYNRSLSASEIVALYNQGYNPAVYISSPATEHEVVSGTTTLIAEVTEKNVDAVQFMLDGNAIGDEVTVAPYKLDWNSESVVNGSHEVSAIARNSSGKSTASAPVGITVANGDGIMVHVVQPISTKKVLPNELPIPGKPSLTLSATAARGEFEPVSFAIRSQNTALSNVSVTVSDLINGPNTIPALAVDVKTVKAWFQSGLTAWSDINQSGDFTPNLVPELLLNDDSLVSADLINKINRVRINGAYVSVSDPATSSLRYYTFAEFPVEDATSFRVFHLPAAETKQLWLTVHVPDGAPGGIYTGTVTISAEGSVVRTLALAVKVLNFDLHEANIEYSLYYTGKLDASKASIGHDYKNETQMRAELLDMKNHGVKNPTMYQNAGDTAVEAELALRRDLGMHGGPLYFLGLGVETVPMNTLDTRVPPLLSLAHSYGFTDLYLYGHDEASGQALLDQRPNWQRAHELGAKVFVAGYDDSFQFVGDLLDTLVHAGRPLSEYANQWHSVNHRIYNYGHPQVGAEDPLLYRCNYGASIWAAGYDGVMNFAYQYSFGRPWNDFDNTTYRDHNFTYPTINGVIGTIAWEGFREAYDDARYIATLEAAIASGQASPVLAKRTAAAAAQTYLDGLRASVLAGTGTGSNIADFPIDLYAMRADIANHIETILTASDLHITPSNITFGSQAIGSGTSTQTVTITNSSNGNPVGTVVNITGANWGDFTVSPGSCPSLTPTIAAGASCTVNVTFVPTATGPRSATLQVSSNDPTDPTLAVPLIGNGVQLNELSISLSGTGGGTVVLSTGSSCSADCSMSFTAGTSVTLTPSPATGSSFFGWSGCDITDNLDCTITMNTVRNVTASFTQTPSQAEPVPALGPWGGLAAIAGLTRLANRYRRKD